LDRVLANGRPQWRSLVLAIGIGSLYEGDSPVHEIDWVNGFSRDTGSR